MRAKQIETGHHYIAKVNDKLTVVRVLCLSSVNYRSGWRVCNIATGRETTIRGASRFRRVAQPDEISAKAVLYPAVSAIETGLDKAEQQRQETQPGRTSQTLDSLLVKIVSNNMHTWQIGQQMFCRCGAILDASRDVTIDLEDSRGKLAFSKAYCSNCWAKAEKHVAKLCQDKGYTLKVNRGN